ncbi:hypothetical protein HPB47_016198, partial [Ixodes persulcatus]
SLAPLLSAYLFYMLLNNPRQFWRFVNEKLYSEINLVNSCDDNIWNSECANILNTVFSDAFTVNPPITGIPP